MKLTLELQEYQFIFNSNIQGVETCRQSWASQSIPIVVEEPRWIDRRVRTAGSIAGYRAY